jgi:hypothetical protein
MEEAGINYSRKTIVQASHLKTQIKSMGIRMDSHMIFSIDNVWSGQKGNCIFLQLIGRKAKGNGSKCGLK